MVTVSDAILVLLSPVVPDFTADCVILNGVIVSWNAAKLGTQPTANQLSAVTDAQVTAYYTSAERAGAVTLATDPSSAYKLDRAILLSAVDQLNVLREWIGSFQSATAAATSLADFKTRVAALATLPDITISAAKAAIAAKINSGAAD